MRKDDEDEDSSEGGAVSYDSRTREICLVGGVDDETTGLMLTALRKLDRKKGGPIGLVLATGGGDEEDGWSLYDAIRTAHHDVNIEAYGHCHSIGSLILQAGDLRLVSENCRMLLHNGHVAMRGDYRVVQTGAAESKFRTKRYYEALAERSGQAVAKIKKLCDDETVLSAQEYLTLGLADGIITGRPQARRKK